MPDPSARAEPARFDDTHVDFDLSQSVVAHVARHAAERPDALAVADERSALSYRELDACANRLARVLHAHGAGPEACVALCVGASVAMVVGALAALKARAAYVPIDPDYPAERIELIVEDTAPVALLVDATTPAAVLAANAERAIRLDDDPAAHDHAGRDASPLDALPDPRSLAYVVYTSGSTGRPKGVEVEHRSLANLALAQGHACGTTPEDRLAQTASPAFDATVMEIWHPLVAGASLHVAPHAFRRDPRRLVQWMVEQRISVSMVATALVAMLFDRGDLYRELTVRRLMTGGAALLTRPAPDTPFPLVNMYGPTETTVVATQGVVPSAGDGPPTIGRPLANTLVHVLDPERRPLGVGEIGEVWIGGVQVARGYRGRPDLTAERFLPDPFADDPEGRMYRTGDLGAWRADGELEFHGRVDDQIAIRGYRIEPQEVEAAVTSLPAVEDAVALAVRHGRRGEQLAVYYTTTEPAPTVAEVRAHARAILPEYMVPTAYVRMEAFALTPNGKIDRKGLPAPTFVRADLDGAYVAPRDARETQVAAVFADVLELDRVGIEDDFFALGGDSLDAVSCVAAVGDALAREVTVQELYAAPTVARLLAALDGGGAGDGDVDWAAEARPEPEDVAPAARGGARGRDVLLTGASGFLGPHLLAELLAATRDEGGRVHALVRAPSAQAGAERLRRALVAERRDVAADWERVVVVPGDLAAPRLGLSADDFDTLAAGLGAIVHSGAQVHHLHDYARLRAANVGGTREALRLARRAGDCAFHYVSSITTTLELRDGVLRERADADRVPPPDTGYGQTKWVSERLVLAAAAAGTSCRIVRLPRAMAGAHSGATSTSDATVRLLRGCVELGAFPAWDGWEPWAPVDVLAAALASSPFDLAGGPAVVYPPAAVARFGDVFGAAAAYGFPLEPLPPEAWLERLRAAGEANPAAAIFHELGIGEGAGPTGAEPAWDVAPQLAGPPCPPLDREYVWRMLDYLVSVGYLAQPAAVAA